MIIAAPYPWSHIQAEWDVPEIRRYYERLSHTRRLIRYDGRGTGLSSRSIRDFSLSALVGDLETIADSLSFETFDLLGIIASGPVAIRYAAEHPERVSNLILWSTYAQASDYTQETEVQATRALIDKNWQLYTETVAHTLLGWSEGPAARRYAALIRQGVTLEGATAFIESSARFDVSRDLSRITCPTLVLHRRGVSWMSMRPAESLTSRISDSRLAVLEGSSILPFLGDMESAVWEIESFLDPEGTRMPPKLREQKQDLSQTTVSHYLVLNKIGEGGMGVLYAARDLNLGRTVALKCLRPAALTPDRLRRFLKEAKTASSLNHPNVCTIYEIGNADSDAPFIAMELIDGMTLASRIASGPLTREEVTHIALQIAEGLQEAHDKGIVHRDVKPANIMLTPTNKVKILDFGLAENHGLSVLTADGSTVTAGGAAPAGTCAYMSPEQILGRRLDSRTDIFSFGVVLYQMITGKLPFQGAAAIELFDRIRNENPPPVSEQRPGFSAFDRVVSRCLEKSREARYQSLRELVQDLGQEVPARHSRLSTTAHHYQRIAVAAMIVAVVAFAWFRLRPDDSDSSISTSSVVSSVAVLPFINLSGNSADEYFSDGVTEELIGALAKFNNIRVVARTSVFQFKGKNIDVRQIGAALGVDTIVEGSVRRSGDRVKVSAQAINVADGYNKWAEDYDTSAGDILDTEDQIAEAIAQTLHLTLVRGNETVSSRHVPTEEAHDEFLQALPELEKRTPASIQVALGHFDEARKRDPLYAAAYVGIADVYALLASHEYGAVTPLEAMPTARALARKALELDPGLAEAHVSLAQVLYQYDWEWKNAEEEFRRGLDLNPNYAAGHHWYAEFLASQQRFEESFKEVDKALAVDPLSLIIQVAKARIYYFAHDLDASVQIYRDILSKDASFLVAHAGLGYAYAAQNQPAAAVEEFEKAIAIAGRIPVLLGSLGYGYGLNGEPEKANAIIQELDAIGASQYVVPAYRAIVYLGLGDRKRVLDELERAHQERSPSVVFLNVDPALDSLRKDPAFQQLLEKVGLK
jgi:eukaryotic-like serine/threonine-protein kinase